MKAATKIIAAIAARPALLLMLSVVFLITPLLIDWAQSRRPPPLLIFEDGFEQDAGTPIKVHVRGAVQQAGVYELESGARVADAVAAAGGALAGADPEAINLARRLRDGEQIVVPQAVPVRATRTPPVTPVYPLDLNAADQAQLEGLPGIGEAYARRIIDSRSVDGPFKSIVDLVSRRVVPQSAFEKIRDLVAVSR